MTRCVFRFQDGQRCQYPSDHAGIAHSWELYIDELIAEGRAAALEERDAEWRKAINTPHVRFHLEEPCDWCAPLRALLNQGRDESRPFHRGEEVRGHLRESDPDQRVHTDFPSEVWTEMKAEAARLDRSPSWLAQWAWRIAKSRIGTLRHEGRKK